MYVFFIILGKIRLAFNKLMTGKELAVLVDMIHNCIAENARDAQNQGVWRLA